MSEKSHINIFYLFAFIFIEYLYLCNSKSNNIFVVVSSCPKKDKLNIDTNLIPFNVIILKCNKTTNYQDSNEAGLMLDFIIRQYAIMKKNKFIFVHDHVKSWHYSVSLYDRLKYLKNIGYIYNVSFSGIFCTYIVFGRKRGYDRWFNKTYEVDKYMRRNGYTNLSLYQLYTEKYIFPCCSTFVVDSSRIKKHSKSFYIKLRRGIKEYVISGGDNNISGGYMEYMWSILFGIIDIPLPPDCNKTKI